LLMVLALGLTTGPASAQLIYITPGAADPSPVGSSNPSSMNFSGTFDYNPANTAYNDILWVIIPIADAPNLSTATSASYGFAAGSWNGYQMAFNFDGVFMNLPGTGVYLPPTLSTGPPYVVPPGPPVGDKPIPPSPILGPRTRYAIYLANLSPVGAGSLHPYWQCFYVIDVHQEVNYSYVPTYNNSGQPTGGYHLSPSSFVTTKVDLFDGPRSGLPYCGP